MTSARRDLDSPAAIDDFVDRFYERVLADPLLAPVFLDVARVTLEEHLPRIKAYWRKMLLGDHSYRRHMMAQHRAIDARRSFSSEHYARWLLLFEQSLTAHFHGPGTERAKTLARRIAGNMRRNLAATRLWS
ncbi:MAG: group III truncated hemoglobin [Pseudomonadota bacterium]